jgi:hypothetical protein
MAVHFHRLSFAVVFLSQPSLGKIPGIRFSFANANPIAKGNLMHEISEQWLEQINRRMSDAGIPYKQRPFLALQAWSQDRNVPVRFPSEISKRVIEWFYRNSPPQAHHIGALFTGLFYYDVYFWPVVIPLAYGSVRLDPFTSIKEMPEVIQARLRSDTLAHAEFLALWADCLDYGFGRIDISGRGSITGFAAKLLTAANEQLEAMITVLRESRPNSKAMDSGRMATEMFLKGFLAAHANITEHAAKKLGHHLESALRECLNVRPASELSQLQVRIGQFPDVGSRYEGLTYAHADLWNAYGTAQFAGSAVVRSLSDRNMRHTVELALTEHSKKPSADDAAK